VNDWLWTELHDLFDIDDGSLPAVVLNYRDTRSVVEAFAYLRTLGQDVTCGGSRFWSITQSEERRLDSVPNAAELVLSGEAEPIQFLLGGIVIDGTVLPDLGIFVFEGGIELDYRMGEEWRSPELTAFFRLLLNLAKLDRNSSLALEDGTPPEVIVKFQRCWQRFIAEQGA
jgi:hypothetical protein